MTTHTTPQQDNLLGICHALGETFGFNPLYLRLALLPVLLGLFVTNVSRRLLARLLRLDSVPRPADSADALALALTYAQESRSPIARVSRKL